MADHKLKSLKAEEVKATEENASIRLSATEYGHIAHAVCSCGWTIGAHRGTVTEAKERAERQWRVHVAEAEAGLV